MIFTRRKSVTASYLACSDGLSGMVEDAEILRTIDELAWNTEDLLPLVNTLIEKANANGGDDNVTCVVARVDRS